MRHSKTWKTLATAIVVASISSVTPVAGADPQWASVWTANPSGTTGVIPPGTQVLREIISPRRAGETVRLRLTNREGTLPVTFAQVWIGTQDEPPRDFRRLQLLRDWSHDEAYPAFFP